MKVRFEKSEQVADHIYSFYFAPVIPSEKQHYVAGQFIELRVPHDDRDNRGDRRWFTLSSAPTEDSYAITTKFAAKDGSSFKDALRVLKPGSEVDMAAPIGDFVLPKDPSIPLVFVAGGIGVTPFRSMIAYVHDKAEKRDISLLYAANKQAEVAFEPVLKQLGSGFKAAIDTRLTAETIMAAGKPDESYYYLSGPEPMIQALQQSLKEAGVNKRHIQTDFFPGYASL